MSQHSNFEKRDLAFRSASSARQRGAALARSSDVTVDPVSDFDPSAWQMLIAEQRLRIAQAAGVHPSKVKIQIGH